MRFANAMGAEGFVIPQIASVTDVSENSMYTQKGMEFEHGQEVEEPHGAKYRFFVYTNGGHVHRIESSNLEDLEERRNKVIVGINKYYAKD